MTSEQIGWIVTTAVDLILIVAVIAVCWPAKPEPPNIDEQYPEGWLP